MSPPTPDSRAPSPSPSPSSSRPVWLLLIGAALGLGLAAFGLLEGAGSAGSLPPEAAARVGDRLIRRVDYERVLVGVESDLRSPVDAAMRRRVLERMIDEELLVQRAIDLGLATIDRRIRGELTSALIDSIVADAEAEAPDEREVAAHFEQNADFFSRPGRLRARTLFFSARSDRSTPARIDPRAPAAERARIAAEQLVRGRAVEQVRAELADPQVSPLPDVLLPPSKIRDYVGPSVLQAIESLEAGEWSEPIESPAGFHLAQLIDSEAPVTPRLEEIEALVRQDLERRRGDDALRRYLDELRAEIPVSVDESVFGDAR
ncbi:MAG: peptidylprolyl isomerase [bacterium]